MNLPPQAGPARDAAILAAVQAGQCTWSWTALNMGRVTVNVTTDGVKLDGVRLAGSATLCQQVADLLGAVLMTPKINDQCFLQAPVQIAPQTMWPNGTDTASMVAESAKMDVVVAGRTGLVAPVGKPWVLAKALTATRAALYGWQSSAPITGVPLYAGVTPGVKVVQPLSTAHAPTYVDYSSTVSLVSRNCLVDGKAADLREVLVNPALAGLVSHEGVVPVRQPGVAELSPMGGAVASLNFSLIEPEATVVTAGPSIGLVGGCVVAGFVGALLAMK